MKLILAAAAACSVLCAVPAAAVTTTLNNDPNALAASLTGLGVTFTSATLTSDTQNGTFTDGASTVGFDRGVILTTGVLGCAGSTNISNSCTGSGSGSTLTLGFTATNASLFFNYVFASEEYNEFVNSNFNDRFSLTLTGANYAGVNLAELPGNGGVVSINNVNLTSNSAFYRNNREFNGSPSLDLPIEYDGLTTVLTASATDLVIGEDYSLVFDVRDFGDTSLDSAVFVQANSIGIVTPPGGVPEPATWAMMIGGIGLAGGSLRRRRATRTTVRFA